MSYLFRSTALCALLAGAPALALTPQEAWEGSQAQLKAMGLPITAEATRDGDALQVGSISLQFDFPKVKGYVTIPGPRFTPGENDSVIVSYPSPYVITIGGEAQDEGKFDAVIEGQIMGQDAIMTGNPARIVTDWTHQGMAFQLKSLSVDDQPFNDASMMMKILGGTVNSVAEYGTDKINVTSESAAQGMDISYDLTVPGEDGGAIKAAIHSGPTATAFTMVMPAEGVNWLASQDQIRDGRFSMDMTSRVESYETTQTMEMGQAGTTTQQSSTENYEIFVKAGPDGLSYGGTTGKFGFTMANPELPFPIAMNGAGVDFDLGFPLLKSDQPQPMKLVFALEDFTLNDEIWNLFDPGQGLPRDPANLAIHADGTMMLNMDLPNVQAMMDEGGPQGMPALPVKLDVSKLLLSAAGASLDGNATMQFKGMPDIMMSDIPVQDGKVNLTLTGANALIDKLVEIGLMSQEDAMGARMMSGMILKPGTGDDVLTSEIEIKPDGSVSANGQRLR